MFADQTLAYDYSAKVSNVSFLTHRLKEHLRKEEYNSALDLIGLLAMLRSPINTTAEIKFV